MAERVVSEYRPIGSAFDLFTCREPICGVDGPTRTGKSRACLEKVNACLLKYEGARALFVRQACSSLRKTGLQTFEDDVLGRDNRICVGSSRDTRTTDYKYPNGSSVSFSGLDDPAKILSGEYDIIFVQQMEECAEQDIQLLVSRLSGKAMPYRQIIFDCNPGPPTHWIKAWEAEGRLKLFNSRHQENPRLYDNERGEWTELGKSYIAGLDAMPDGFVKDRLRYGLWVSPEGARFKYDPKIHEFRTREKWPYGLPRDLDIYIGMDWGTSAPFAALWIAIDTEKNAWVFREAYEPGLTADEQAELVVAMTAQNEQIRAIYPDPSTFNTHSAGNVAIADLYQTIFGRDKRFGPVCEGTRHQERRKMGMATLDAMLGRDNGFPNLYVDSSCINYKRELMEAYWWVPKHGLPKEEIDPKCDDHAITASYYCLGQFYQAAAPPAKQITTETIAQEWARMRIDGTESQWKPVGGRRFRV